MMEKIPFLHRNTAYNILVKDDISFNDLHSLLDDLISQGAFHLPEGNAELYHISCNGVDYTVGVDGQDVMIVEK